MYPLPRTGFVNEKTCFDRRAQSKAALKALLISPGRPYQIQVSTPILGSVNSSTFGRCWHCAPGRHHSRMLSMHWPFLHGDSRRPSHAGHRNMPKHIQSSHNYLEPSRTGGFSLMRNTEVMPYLVQRLCEVSYTLCS